MESDVITKIITSAVFGLMFGPVVSVMITPIFCLLRKIFFVPFNRQKFREKAEKKGHVVEATLQKYHTIDDDPGMPIDRKMGTYTYQVKGKKYKYRLMTSNRLPSTITLFYLKKPRKATTSGNLGNRECPWFKFYLIISLIVAIVSAVAVGILIV